MKTFTSIDVKFLKPYKKSCDFLFLSLSAWANARLYLNKEIRRFKESFQNKHSLHVFVKCVSFCAFTIFEIGEAKLRNADSLYWSCSLRRFHSMYINFQILKTRKHRLSRIDYVVC